MNTRTRKLVYTALFAALTAVGAFLRIPMVYSSVTLQYLFTAMAGLLLGRRWGALSQAVYVLRGNTVRQATALAIDEQFGLTVQYENGETETVRSGEVSVRGLYGYIE